MKKEKRVEFYIGTLLDADVKTYELNSDVTLNSNVNYAMNYHNKLKMLLKKTKHYGKKLNYAMGDNESEQNPTFFLKNRNRDSKNGVILRCLNTNRHWRLYYNKPPDISFDDKVSKIVWRGTTTGKPHYKGNRFDLVTNYYAKHKDINVGFSFICQGKYDYSKYVKGRMSISEMLKYKYIISVEGNDKDSGLNWKLNSNSVVIMPRPRITSWLMETTLIPDVHYVLIKDDFSDLEEKLSWCENNQNKCKEIVKNANMFMSQFSNELNERQIEEEVVHKYFDILSNHPDNK